MRFGNSCVLAALGLLGVAAGAGAQPVPTKAPTQADYTALGQLPDWSGAWQPDWSALFSGQGGRNAEKPAFTPAAQKVSDAFVAAQKKGENLQTEMANCMPAGMPQIMRMPYPIEFLFTPQRVTILIETEQQVRRIYTDGRPLPTDPDPTFNGSSIGHWEGDTLIVETIGLNPKTENTRIRETFRLQKPDLMVVTATITDPALFATPFVQTTPYARHREWQIREYVCQENNRDAADPFGRPSMNIEQ
jgi:hypothetical protein